MEYGRSRGDYSWVSVRMRCSTGNGSCGPSSDDATAPEASPRDDRIPRSAHSRAAELPAFTVGSSLSGGFQHHLFYLLRLGEAAATMLRSCVASRKTSESESVGLVTLKAAPSRTFPGIPAVEPNQKVTSKSKTAEAIDQRARRPITLGGPSSGPARWRMGVARRGIVPRMWHRR